MNELESVLNKVNDAKLMAMNFACWKEDEVENERMWRITYCIKDCLEKLKEIANEDSKSA